MRWTARLALFGIIVFVLSLTGCANQQVGDLKILSREDVEAALALAEEGNDELAVQCHTYLLTRSTDIPDIDEGLGLAGPLSAYQLARNTRRKVTGVSITNEFRIACGPMLMESRAALTRLGIRVLSPL